MSPPCAPPGWWTPSWPSAIWALPSLTPPPWWGWAPGSSAPNSGVPGEIGGYTVERLLRAPAAGLFQPAASIGDTVSAGQVVGTVAGVPMTAQIDGVLRGLLPEGTPVSAGMKAGDVDPRCRREHCFSVSDKARAVGGGVLEALLCRLNAQGLLPWPLV